MAEFDFFSKIVVTWFGGKNVKMKMKLEHENTTVVFDVC